MDIEIDVTKTKLETRRLILRAWKKQDLNALYEYASVEGVGEMAGWEHHQSLDVSKSVLQLFLSEKNVWAVVDKENNKAIGSLGLHISWADDEADYAYLKLKEIGYVLSKDYWGQGLMAEAAGAVIHSCFNDFELDGVTARHALTNKQSKRVLEKCGFEYVTTKETCTKDRQLSFHGVKYILLNPKCT